MAVPLSARQALAAGATVAHDEATAARSNGAAETDEAKPAPSRRDGLTARALIAGALIGGVLAAGNVYTGLKSMLIDAGALTAALMSFVLFAAFRRRAGAVFGPLENNLVQTIASSAGVMSFVHGLMGPIPALHMLGHRYPSWALWIWGLALAMVGIMIAVVLRRKLIVEDALPFPSGAATAELIQAMHGTRRDPGAAPAGTESSSGDSAMVKRRFRMLALAAAAAVLVAWLRDGRLALIPQAVYLPVTIFGISASSLTLGIAASPILAGTGVFMGLRSAFGLLIGSAIAFALLSPALVRHGWVHEAAFGQIVSWMVWPSIGIMLSAAAAPLLFNARSVALILVRTARDAVSLVTGPRSAAGGTHGGTLSSRGRRASAGWALVLSATALLMWTGWRGFGIEPALTLLVLAFSVVLTAICSRAAGETDLAPVGSVGILNQVLFATRGPTAAMFAGSIVSGSSSQAAQTLWSFKAGRVLGASWRNQVVAQIFGAVVGSLVVVPTYLLIIRRYPLATEAMPAASALTWKATAEAIAGGLSALPPHAFAALLGGGAFGLVTSALARTRMGRFVPSPTAIGIGLITPFSLSAAAVLGAALVLAPRRRLAGFGDGEASALAAGALVGESLSGIVMALFS